MVQPRSTTQSSQHTAVVLRIGIGNFTSGFQVIVQILKNGELTQEHHDLPNLTPARNLSQLYQAWKDIAIENSRRLQGTNHRKLQAVPVQKTNVADLEDWRQQTEKLEDYCRSWFQAPEFKSLRDRIQANLNHREGQPIPIVICCDTGDPRQDDVLRRLPWHLWDLLVNDRTTEFVLFTRFHHRVSNLTFPIRILAIFGSSEGGLKLEQDAAALRILEQRGAQITKCLEPNLEDITPLLQDQVWDILFFAGHSSSKGSSGRIQINQDDSLRLEDLRHSLSSAVTHGLKLAIFNSCDGLGIADFLTELNVPVTIVMRQPVPDQIACQFLLHFLTEFSQGKPLCLAVRAARVRLESLQTKFPGASWLPTICQNPNQPQLLWHQPSWLRWFLHRLRHGATARTMALFSIICLLGVAIPMIARYRCQIFPGRCPDPLTSTKKFISDGSYPVAEGGASLSEPYLSLKQRGIQAFAQGQYRDAVTLLDGLREVARQNREVPELNKFAITALQDPEILIYRNNAFVTERYQQPGSAPLYTIAVAAPLNRDEGIGIILGVAQAQDIAVKQGINLRVLIANDNNNPDQAQQVAQLLVQDPAVLAVVGHYTSPNTCAALNVYSPNHLVIVAPTSTLVNLQANPDCGGDPNRVFFRTVSNSRVEATTLVQYLIQDLNKPQPKVAAFYNAREAFSKEMLEQIDQVLRAYGGQITTTVDLSNPNLNLQQLPPDVQTADALAVLPDGGTVNTLAFQKAIDVLKWNDGNKPVLGANTLYVQRVIAQAGRPLIRNLFIAVDWHPKQCGAAEFARQVNDYWGGDLNRRTALAYEAVQVILQAIASTSTSKITRRDIQQRLSETGIKPDAVAASAVRKNLTISFDARGDRREITRRAIATVNEQLKFDLAKDLPCPG